MPAPKASSSARIEPAARLASGEAVVAGVLSGTSGDGIDVALVRFAPRGAEDEDLGKPEVLAFETRAFPAPVAVRVRAALDGDARELGTPRAIALLSRDLGRTFGEAAAAVVVAVLRPLCASVA